MEELGVRIVYSYDDLFLFWFFCSNVGIFCFNFTPEGVPVERRGLSQGFDFIEVEFLENVALIVFDFKDGVEGDFDAAVGKDAKGNGEIDHLDFTAAQGKGETVFVWVIPASNAHGRGGGDHSVDAIESELFNGRNIVGVTEGETHLGWTMRGIVIVLGAIEWLTFDRETSGDIEIHRGGGPALKETNGIVKRFD